MASHKKNKRGRGLAVFFLLLVFGVARAGTDTAPASATAYAQKKRPKVAIVLSGGGARGLAHVGVFKALEKMRIPYDCIVGTSMGAIAGGSFATGISTQAAENKVVTADWDAVFADKPRRADIPYFRKSEDYRPYFDFRLTLENFRPLTPRNFIGVQHIGLFFRELTDARAAENFDDLPIPFRAIGTDIITGEAVVMNDGTVAEAMRASMTVPGVFPPFPYKGHLLVDGGLARNVPVSEGRKLCGDVVIAVNTTSPNLRANELVSFFNIGEQVINISMQANMDRELALLKKQDVLLVPDLSDYASTDFKKVAEIIKRGEEVVEQHAEQLKPLQVSEEEYAAWRKQVEARKPSRPVIEQVIMAPMRWVNPDVMSDLLKLHPGTDFDMEALHRNISKVYARGDFSRISYDLINSAPGEADLLITPEEKPGRDFLRFGLGLYTDFKGDGRFTAVASLRRAWLNQLDGEWRTDVQVGRDLYLDSEWYQPASLGSELFVAPYAFYGDQFRNFFVASQSRQEYEYTQVGAGLEVGSVFGRWGEFRAGITRSYATTESTSQLAQPQQHYQQGGYTLRSIYDQIDNTHFPHSGSSARLNYFRSSAELGADDNYDRLELRVSHAFTWGRNTALLNVRGGTSFGSTLPFYNAFGLGGLFNLSAYPTDYFLGDELLSGSLLLYRRVSDLPAGLGQGIYSGTAFEAGRMMGVPMNHPRTDNAAISGSVFLAADTVLGPFYLLGALGDRQQRAVYLALGVSF